MAMEALTLRFAHLVDVDPNTLSNPIHVRQLCRAFQKALINVEVSREAQPLIFYYFSKRFISQLQHFYTPFNKLLANQDVLATIEEEIRVKGPQLLQNQRAVRHDPSQRQREEDIARGIALGGGVASGNETSRDGEGGA